MDYHEQIKSRDGVLQSLVDGYEFREIEEKWPVFKDEPCNVKLSLVANGVNPFGELRSIYLVWPIFVIKNIIPPWMSINKGHIMLTMIVLGTFNININFLNVRFSFVLFVA